MHFYEVKMLDCHGEDYGIPLGCLSAPSLKFNVMFWVDNTVGLNACGGFGILGFGIAE